MNNLVSENNMHSGFVLATISPILVVLDSSYLLLSLDCVCCDSQSRCVLVESRDVLRWIVERQGRRGHHHVA